MSPIPALWRYYKKSYDFLKIKKFRSFRANNCHLHSHRGSDFNKKCALVKTCRRVICDPQATWNTSPPLRSLDTQFWPMRSKRPPCTTRRESLQMPQLETHKLEPLKFLNIFFHQAEIYTGYKACKNLAIFNFILFMLLQ